MLTPGQGIASSPYLIHQYEPGGPEPTQRYNRFAAAVGYALLKDAFDYLVGKDTMTLQQVNANSSSGEPYGTWAFWPVTDGTYVKQFPSIQLSQRKVNGVNMFVRVH